MARFGARTIGAVGARRKLLSIRQLSARRAHSPRPGQAFSNTLRTRPGAVRVAMVLRAGGVFVR